MFYYALGRGIANGDGYSTLGTLAPGDPVASAAPSPVSTALASLDLLGLTSFPSHRFVLCVLVAVGLLLIGLVARRVAGERTSLIAAAGAAIHPNFSVLGGMAIVESLHVALIVLTLVVALLRVELPHNRPIRSAP